MPTADDILASLEIGVVGADRDGLIVYVNHASEEIIGAVRKKLIGSPVDAYFGSHAAEASRTAMENLESYYNVGVERQTGLGNTERLILDIFPGFDPDGVVWGSVLAMRRSDLSGLGDTKAGEDLGMERFNGLASMIAHEIRNPLTGIKGIVQLAARTTGDTANSELILREVERIDSIVSELMELTRVRALKLSKTNIFKLIDDVCALMKSELDRTGVLLSTHHDPSIPKISIDESRIRQVIINLIKNAIESMEECSTRELVITTQVTQGLKVKGKNDTLRPFVAIEISDTGGGIAPKDIDHLFAPFFTTKRTGAGLGLFICSKILKEHNGIIKVESTKGKGSVFTCLIPL